MWQDLSRDIKGLLIVACCALFALSMLFYNSFYAFEIDSRNIVFLLMIQVKPQGFPCFCDICVYLCMLFGQGLAMMASIGLVAQHYWKLPGFENLPSGFSVLGTQEGLLGLFALFLVSGCLENSWREDPNGAKEPGNFGDPFGLQMYTQDMRMKELNNGRMAMISVLGIFAAEMVSGKDVIQQFGLPGSRPWSASVIRQQLHWQDIRPVRSVAVCDAQSFPAFAADRRKRTTWFLRSVGVYQSG